MRRKKKADSMWMPPGLRLVDANSAVYAAFGKIPTNYDKFGQIRVSLARPPVIDASSNALFAQTPNGRGGEALLHSRTSELCQLIRVEALFSQTLCAVDSPDEKKYSLLLSARCTPFVCVCARA